MKMNEKYGNTDLEIYSVTRGEPISEGQALAKVWDQVHAGKYKEADLAGIFKRIKENKWNYSGSFYAVTFRVNKPINLVELGFYGPFKEEKASYFVHVELFEPLPKEVMPLCTSKVIGKRKLHLMAEPNEVFCVDFGRVIPLRSKTWYMIQFMIDGPDMMRCDKAANTITVKAHGTDYNFEFAKGSLQMPIIKFTVPDPESYH